MIGIDWPNRDERHPMNLIRKSAWAVVILGAVAGCTSDEPSSNPGTPTTNLPKAPAKPVVPAPPEAAKEGRLEGYAARRPKPGREEGRRSPKLERPKAEPKADTRPAPPPPSSRPTRSPRSRSCPRPSRTLALKQAVCPVSGQHLGSMGKPIKVTAEGRTFFLCCDELRGGFKKDPKAVIAKLDARPPSNPSRDPVEAAAGGPGLTRHPHPFEQAGVWQRADARDILLPHASDVGLRGLRLRRRVGSASLPR